MLPTIRRWLAVAILVVMSLVSSTMGVSAKSLAPANQYGSVTLTASSQCPNAQTLVNLPIDPTQNPPIKSITVSGNVNGSIHLFDHNGLINTNVTGSAPYSFTTTSSDMLQACVTNGGSGTVSFQGQLNMLTGNWAGYTVEGFNASPNEYFQVMGYWQVPAVTCKGLLRTYDSSTWIGLGGAPNTGSSKIEQIGTEQDCNATIPNYFAVYENFPDNVVKIDTACSQSSPNQCISVPATVQANDQMRAWVIYRAANPSPPFVLLEFDDTQQWYVTLYENEGGGSYDPSVRYTAEWIEEFPQHTLVSGLANFGQVTFTNCNVDWNIPSPGSNHPIKLAGPSIQQLTMKHPGGSIMAQPSGLTGSGSSFSVSFVNH